MESDQRLPTGQWTGFFLDTRLSRRGWMHLYLEFAEGKLKGEGTDFVGPWLAEGQYDTKLGTCVWAKRYVGAHQVNYRGNIDQNGIVGVWEIGPITGEFHIWPASMSHLSELYLADDRELPAPTMQLGKVRSDDSVSDSASF